MGAKVIPLFEQVTKYVNQRLPKLDEALPNHMRAATAARHFFMEIQRNPKLLNCTVESLYKVLAESCHLGLYPGSLLKHAYIIPYGKEAKLIAGYQGMIDLATRGGLVKKIAARVVYKDDVFRIDWGDDEKIIHQPNYSDERVDENISGAYAIAVLENGEKHREFVTRAELFKLKVKQTSQLKDYQQKEAAWNAYFVAMCRKTAVRRIAKYLPMSPDKLMMVGGKVSDGERFLELVNKQESQEKEVLEINKAITLEPSDFQLIDEVDDTVEIEKTTLGYQPEEDVEKKTAEKAKIMTRIEEKIENLYNEGKGVRKKELYEFLGVRGIAGLREMSTKDLIKAFQALSSYNPGATRKKTASTKPIDRSSIQKNKEAQVLENLKNNEYFSKNSKVLSYISAFQKRHLRENDSMMIIAGLHRLAASDETKTLDALLAERAVIGM